MNYLITGASGGIGRAVAEALDAQGHRLALHYQQNLPPDIGCRLCADLGEADSGAWLVASALDALGSLDGLVLCHGVALQRLAQDTDEADWGRLFNINVTSMQRILRTALPHLIARQAGSIVLLSSMWGITGASCESAYSATKGALIALTKSLAKELGPSHIRVNCVAPGLIDTPMNANLSAEELSAIAAETPLGRIGTPQDVANGVAFLLSEQAGFITGQTLTIDGGLTV